MSPVQITGASVRGLQMSWLDADPATPQITRTVRMGARTALFFVCV